jgi:hypothetical protein
MLPTSRSRFRVLALASGLALAAPLLHAPVATAAATPTAPATPPISLWAPSQVTAYAYRHQTWTDLGLRVIAEGAPFEVWANRASYDKRIQVRWTSGAASGRFPSRSMRTFSGLGRFLDLTIVPADPSAPTRHVTRAVCLNAYSERVRPDAAAHSPYPQGCWYNPYTLGSVQGIQEGWAAPVLQQSRPLHLGPGDYTVTATVRPMYAAALGLTPDQATRTTHLSVVKDPYEDGRATRTTRATADRAATAARPAPHRPTGQPGRTDSGGPVPDLRSLPAWGISLNKAGTLLRFSATVWNAGDSPLVVDGFRRDGEDEMDAYQYFFDAAGNQTGYQPVGHMHWDARPSHQHWHFEDFARYSLLDADQAETARSKKEAFCLANTDAVDLTVPDAAWRPDNTDLATSCGDYSSLSIREVLAAGWGDTYTQYRAGQSFRIADLPNGVYYLAVDANPEGRLVESATDNNLSLRRIRLAGTPDHRRVIVPQVGLVTEEQYGGEG